MKVSLKRLPSWFGPYHLVDSIPFLKLFYTQEELDTFAEKVDNSIFNRIFEKIYDFRIKLNEKLNRVEVPSFVTADVEVYLAKIIVPVLKIYLNTKTGSPEVSDDGVPNYLKSVNSYKETEDSVDSNWHARWDYVLNEMIISFEAVAKGQRNYDKERVQNGIRLFAEYFLEMS